jgi:hypothetical protein
MKLMLDASERCERLRVRIPAATFRTFQGRTVPAGLSTYVGVVRGATTDPRPGTRMT